MDPFFLPFKPQKLMIGLFSAHVSEASDGDHIDALGCDVNEAVMFENLTHVWQKCEVH